MTNPKHTPGPWHVAKCKSGEVEVRAYTGKYILGVKDSEMVCQFSFHPDERTSDKTKANAALIAAAPKLLEAVRRAVNIIESEWPEEQAKELTKYMYEAIDQAEKTP